MTFGIWEERGGHHWAAWGCTIQEVAIMAALSGLPRGMCPLLDVWCIGSETAELALRGQECARPHRLL